MASNSVPFEGGAARSSQGDLPIGDIIRQTNNLSAEQVERVLAHQRETGLKFGEAAVALGLARREDVLWALSQQFQYPYAESKQQLHPDLVVASDPFSLEAEAFRDMRSHIIMSVLDGTPSRRALAVVSPNSGDGKSHFASNLAFTFGQLGVRTLLVDADMRTPRLHDIYRVNGASGLSGILSGRIESSVMRPIDDLPSLYLLPVGVVPPNPLELVQRPTFELLLKELQAKFDYIIVDTPAMTHGSDARVIAGKCGAALAVARRGTSRMQQLHSSIGLIKKTGAHFAGVVMNEY
jgi:chain length determinant protein tyrosine kinase EpsG